MRLAAIISLALVCAAPSHALTVGEFWRSVGGAVSEKCPEEMARYAEAPSVGFHVEQWWESADFVEASEEVPEEAQSGRARMIELAGISNIGVMNVASAPFTRAVQDAALTEETVEKLRAQLPRFEAVVELARCLTPSPAEGSVPYCLELIRDPVSLALSGGNGLDEIKTAFAEIKDTLDACRGG